MEHIESGSEICIVECDDVEACELAAVLRQQSAGYALLARLFGREVDEELLDRLCSMRFPAHTGNGLLDLGYRDLCRYLNGRWERTRSELAVDYFRTFIGNTQEVSQVAFPYESVYTSPEHLLMQDARDEVLAAYRAARVVLDEEANTASDPEDHVAYELSFARMLGERAADAFEAGDEATGCELLATKRSFICNHLLNWAPAFAADVERIAQTRFYRALGNVLMGYLEVDQAFLGELLGQKAA